ncbi:MAG: triple tyrosine motif-containing protein, partial [Bacteroidota bacterium]
FSFDRILEKSSVRCVTKSLDGDLWIGSYDGLYNTKSGQNPSLVSADFFYSFYREDSTSIWGCTEGGSLRKLDKTTQKVEAVFPLTNDKFTRVLHRDEKGVEWLGGYGFLEKGSYANDGKPLAYNMIAEESLENIYALATSKKDGLWVGCMNGLFLVNQREEVLKNKHLPSFYSSETVLCLEPYMDGNTLWVGSKFAGLFLIDNESGKVLKHYGTHNLLPDNTIASIVNVKDSLLFLGTNKGLCKLDVAAEVVTTYIERNSNLSNEYNHGASFEDEAGNLYFGTINGMVYFHPDSLRESQFEQRLYFTTFEKIIPESNEMGLASSILDTKKRLEVFPDENIFTISFSSDNLFANRKSNIYYQMENLNPNWVKTTSNQVTYNNLEPGDYTFKVKLESLDAKDQVIGVPVKVYPQFYQTLWFKGSIILGVFGVISFVYRFRIQQLKKEQHIRENISRNIHDDLGGSLTYLHIQAKKLYKSEAASTKNIAHKLLQHSKLSLESLTNLLWVLDAADASARCGTRRTAASPTPARARRLPRVARG